MNDKELAMIRRITRVCYFVSHTIYINILININTHTHTMMCMPLEIQVKSDPLNGT